MLIVTPGSIRPAYAQCSLITPTRTYSGQRALQYTYNMDGDFYLVQTPGGGMVLGRWDMPVLQGRQVKQWHRVGNEDDSSVMAVWTKCKYRCDWSLTFFVQH
jgi:hypothetical protein